MFSNPEKILIQFGVSPGLYVADFGAGNGYYVRLLSELVGDTGKVYAIDVHRDMVRKIAKSASDQGLDNVEAIWSDLEKEHGSTLPDASVDVVVIANTLFSLEDKKSVLSEAFRVLRRKGRILLVEWADSYAGIGPHRDHVVAKSEAEKMFRDAGFEFDKDIEAGEHHYGMVWRKS